MNTKESSLAGAATSAKNFSLTLKEAFDIYQKQNDGIHKLWAYFQIVSIALIGYMLGSEKVRWSVSTYAVVSFGYIMFSFANLKAIFVSQKELKNMADAINIMTGHAGPIVRITETQERRMIDQDYQIGRKFAVTSLEPWKVCLFHISAIVAVLIAIGWALFDKYGAACTPP